MLIALIIATSIFSNVAANIVGGLVVLIVTVGGGAWANQRRRKVEDRKEEDKSNSAKLDDLKGIVGEMHVALVGAPRTAMNPFPSPGIVDIVPDLLKRTTKIERTLFVNGGKNNTIVDRLDRVETAVTSGVAGVERIETHQSEQEDARIARAKGE